MTSTRSVFKPRAPPRLRAARLVALVAAVALAQACAAPALTLPTEGTLRDPQGSSSGSAAVVYAGDFTGGPSAGGGARLMHQVSRNVAVGGDLAGGGGQVGSNAGNIVGAFAGRAHARVSPGSDHVAFTGGVGGAVAGGVPHATVDVGARVGSHVGRVVEWYLAESVALSVGFPAQPDNAALYRAVYFDTSVGVIAHPTPAFAVGLNLSALVGVNFRGDAIGQRLSENSAPARPMFVPALFARYTWEAAPAAAPR